MIGPNGKMPPIYAGGAIEICFYADGDVWTYGLSVVSGRTKLPYISGWRQPKGSDPEKEIDPLLLGRAVIAAMKSIQYEGE